MQKNPKQENIQLEVAILLEDLNEAKELTQVLRKAQVFPHFYSDLKSFWEGTLTQVPALAIIDVAMMGDDERHLLDHPLIKSEELLMALFYRKEHAALLSQVQDVFTLGQIPMMADYSVPLRPILKRANKILALERRNHKFSIERDKNQAQLVSVLEGLEARKEKIHYYNSFKNWEKRADDTAKVSADFYDFLTRFLGSWESMTKMGVMELNPTNQKLISPPIEGHKYFKIPSIWLGNACTEGIQEMAQSMAIQVASDLFGRQMMALLITGRSGNPDKILFLQVEDTGLFNHFDWEGAERVLTYHYLNFRMKNSMETGVVGSKMLSPWELMGVLDEQFYAGQFGMNTEPNGERHTLFDIDLGTLTSEIQKRPDNRFHWDVFIHEFSTRMQLYDMGDVQFSFMNLDHLAILCPKEKSEKYFDVIRDRINRYPYWRHFDDPDAMIGVDLTARLRSLPLSAAAYLLHVAGKGVYARLESPPEVPVPVSIPPVGPRPQIENIRTYVKEL